MYASEAKSTDSPPRIRLDNLLAETTKIASDLNDRLCAQADSLCGPVPANAAGARELRPVGNGFFDAAIVQTNTIMDTLRSCDQHLRRLESVTGV